jgi:hypothetical protein
MKNEESRLVQEQLYYRLIALWVICEGVAGGIMHGLNIPFSGMIISGCAVICICLIGYYTGRQAGQTEAVRPGVKGAILKATIIVCIFKMMLSPHTPPTAYLAVFFQGLMGQILFYNLKHYKISCIVLGVLALVESALQRIIVLVVLYGSDFWQAVNDFIKKLLHVKTVTNYTWWLAIGYIFIHAFMGVIIGLMAARIVKRSLSWKNNEAFLIADINPGKQLSSRPSSPRKRKIKKIFFIIWIILLMLFLQSILKIGNPILPSDKALQIFFRSLLIFLTWYFLVSPLLTVWIKKRLEHQKEKSQSDINRIMLLLPSTESIFKKSWDISSSKKGFKRLGLFWKVVLINTLRND